MKDYIIRHIQRKRGNTYTYLYTDKRGNPAPVKDYLKDLYIPPAHDKVKINKQKQDKVLAIGYDTKGRPQYIYNPTYIAKQSKSKFQRMITFGESYQKIIKQIHKDMYQEGDSKNKQIALMLRLVIDCGFRIGNLKYTQENKSYGVSTLEGQHVKLNGPEVSVDFKGKKGVRNRCTVTHKKLRKELKSVKRHSHKHDKLFMYRKGSSYHDVKSTDVNRYLKTFGDFSTKDFRTWGANLECIKQLLATDVTPASSETHKKKCLNQALDKVSEKLHNTRSVCKSNYVDPYVMDIFMNHTSQFLDRFQGLSTQEEYTKSYIDLLKH